jgi:hypothetical protein
VHCRAEGQFSGRDTATGAGWGGLDQTFSRAGENLGRREKFWGGGRRANILRAERLGGGRRPGTGAAGGGKAGGGRQKYLDAFSGWGGLGRGGAARRTKY